MNTLKSNEVYGNDNERRYSVYIHTTPSGKKYIGLTGMPPEKRWDCGRGYLQNSHFFNAILKYGWINIQHEIIYDNLTQEEAKEKEIELIAKYDTTNRRYGYNISRGGDTGSETLEKIIYMYNKDTGGFIRSFKSANEAERWLGKPRCNQIGKHCKENDFTADLGYLWRYEYVPCINIVDKEPVKLLFDATTLTFVERYRSKMGDYIYENNTYIKQVINRNCANKEYLYKDLYCCYQDDINDLFTSYLKDGFHYRCVLQIDIESNSIIKIYRSKRDVKRQTGFSDVTIGDCCLHEIKSAFGFKWESVGRYNRNNYKGELSKLLNILDTYEDKCGLTRIANILLGNELPEIPNI